MFILSCLLLVLLPRSSREYMVYSRDITTKTCEVHLARGAGAKEVCAAAHLRVVWKREISLAEIPSSV